MLLNEILLMKDGKLLNLHGNSRYSQYVGARATGSIANVMVEGGSQEYEEMIKGECLEVVSFSDFQIDPVTGDFGGEVRLALHRQFGHNTPMTGGSITGNIKDVQENWTLSKETDMFDNYLCPVAMKFTNIKNKNF